MMSHLAVVSSPIVALCYERISEDRTGKAAGVKRQHEDNERVARSLGATEIVHYLDNDKSATKTGVIRPQFERLMDDIASDRFDNAIVIAWAQDRITRKQTEYAAMIDSFTLHNIRFVAEADGIDIVPAIDGVLVSSIKSAVAAEETRKLQVRLHRSQLAGRESGKRMGKTPFGWLPDGTADPERAPMVVEATDRVLAGESLTAIAQDWNDRGLPRHESMRRSSGGTKMSPEFHTPVVKEWGYRAVLLLVTRPSNAGWYMHNGVRLEVTPEWEPLVSEDRYRALMNVVQGRRHPKPRQRHFLGGLIVCGKPVCGGIVYGLINVARRPSGDYAYPMYRCNTCKQRIRPITEVDKLISELVVARLRSIRLPDLASASQRAAMGKASDRADALRGKLAAYKDASLTMDPADYASATGALRTALAEAEDEIQRLSDGRKHALAGLTGSRPARTWDSCTIDQRRAVISLLATITLLPGATATPIRDRLSITWTELS